MDFTELNKLISENNSFLITTHVNPDADAIGSEIALHKILIGQNKKSFIINHSKTPYNLKFLDTENIIQKYNAGRDKEIIESVDAVFFLDLNQIDRVVSMKKILAEKCRIKICIDHHQDPDGFADYFFDDINATATGEIIFDFIKSTNIHPVNKEIADPIYAAIMTDSGSFRFERTTSKTHLIAAELLDAGVDPYEIYDKLFDQSHFGKIKLLGEVLKTLTLNERKNIGYMKITREMLKKTGARETDVDGFVNYCLAVENVRIGLLFFELKDGIKISFRSKGKIPVNNLAAEFDGGGHTNAAGTRLFNVKLEDYIAKVVAAAENYI